MPLNFWQKLKKRGWPILALAPMAGFTDSAFRQICKSYGADVLYSEMASATALYYSGLDSSAPLAGASSASAKSRRTASRKEANATLELLKFNRTKERHYVVQLFGAEPAHFAAAARIITSRIKPDGIDINFGCPVPKIVRQSAGSGLMKDLRRSRAVIEAVLANTHLPVSIKIRTKVGIVEAFDFVKNIADLPIAALMIHGRSLSQGFSGEPDWRSVDKAGRIFPGVLLANGGISSLSAARQALKETRADGLGLARGVLGRPWLFKEIKTDKAIDLKSRQIFQIALKQASMEQRQKGEAGIIEFRKHLVWYVQGLPGAAKLRARLVQVSSLAEIKKILG
ncbi:MAG: tRNA-dihydrouridine synthase [Patescibacteria group bacterium]